MHNEGGNSTTQQLLTVLVQATAELTQSNQQQNQKIALLTDQIGHLTEVVTTGFAELKELTQQQSDTAKRQEQNITRFVGIVETLIQQRT